MKRNTSCRRFAAVVVLSLSAFGVQAQPANRLGGGFDASWSAAQVVPDTTKPWRYFPLQVGNVWQYHKPGVGTIDRTIPKDTLINGRRYFEIWVGYADRAGNVGTSLERRVRFDTASAEVRTLGYDVQENKFIEFVLQESCPLNVPFNEQSRCTSYAGTYVFMVEGGYNRPLVFDGPRGPRSDTLRTALKTVRQPFGQIRFAAGVGMVYYLAESEPQVLRYVRIAGIVSL